MKTQPDLRYICVLSLLCAVFFATAADAQTRYDVTSAADTTLRDPQNWTFLG